MTEQPQSEQPSTEPPDAEPSAEPSAPEPTEAEQGAEQADEQGGEQPDDGLEDFAGEAPAPAVIEDEAGTGRGLYDERSKSVAEDSPARGAVHLLPGDHEYLPTEALPVNYAPDSPARA